LKKKEGGEPMKEFKRGLNEILKQINNAEKGRRKMGMNASPKAKPKTKPSKQFAIFSRTS